MPHKHFIYRFIGNRSAIMGSGILALVVIAACSASIIFPNDPLEMVTQPFLWPGSNHEFPFGTDMLGRNIGAGLFYGARISLLIGLASTFVSIGVGLVIGVTAGYFGRTVDDVLMRITELFQTMPPFILAIVLVTILQPSIASIIIGIGLTSWPTIARLVRAEAIRTRHADFVQNAVLVGMSNLRIMATHVVPNALTPVIVAGSILVATSILTEAGLSFLGLGDPNVATWGGMIGAGREVIRTAWYIAAIPGIAIVVVVLGFNLLGDGLNELLNPRTSLL